ncbi:D-sedoheptulose 7-phosphate isomerase [Halobacteriovorax sp. HLS]|uniref:D-sedoheptulose 7-phosphate isomerase n=1 Tax=Halobacteriovorax sp. HLS TaxID=2234000 RepID=UPI000FD73C2F|nr:D-sedoheptulose 7-phosphate isomerase [Halobacteriovorax sp. HLS]
MSTFIKDSLLDAKNTLERFIENETNIAAMESAIKTFIATLNNGGRIYSCGNGGSLCDSMHFAEELTGRYRKDRRALAAMSFSDPSHMSCVGNDFGYDQIFAKMVEAFGQKGDSLLAISTSGNSANVINAVNEAKARGVTTIGLLGKDGGKLKDLVDISIIVESKLTDRIQEIHIKIIHNFIEGIERELFPEHYN